MSDFDMQPLISKPYVGAVDPPLSPEDKPTSGELARLATQLLRELSRDDARVAEKIRERGLDLPSPRPRR